MATKNHITWMDYDTDEEIYIEHPRSVELQGGFYIVQDFKKVKRSEKAVRKLLAEGKTVYHLNAYCGNGSCSSDSDLVFTGKIVWKNEKLYQISCFGGGGRNLGTVPAGTLVVGISDD